MAQKGFDSTKLKIANIAPPARASALLSGQVPAIEFFVMAKPGLEAGAKDAHAELRTFLLSDHGLELYSNGLAVGEDYLASNWETVKAFVRAALKGWKFALANPQKAAEDEIKYVPALKPDIIVAELGIVEISPSPLKSGRTALAGLIPRRCNRPSNSWSNMSG
jgi:NitT/TauT family transport system substrate-binding protein